MSYSSVFATMSALDSAVYVAQELSEMRHSHVKLKKTLQDRCAELEHSRSRAEQYEAEVKKLRCRIEELKSELSSVEDEVRKVYLTLLVSLYNL